MPGLPDGLGDAGLPGLPVAAPPALGESGLPGLPDGLGDAGLPGFPAAPPGAGGANFPSAWLMRLEVPLGGPGRPGEVLRTLTAGLVPAGRFGTPGGAAVSVAFLPLGAPPAAGEGFFGPLPPAAPSAVRLGRPGGGVLSPVGPVGLGFFPVVAAESGLVPGLAVPALAAPALGEALGEPVGFGFKPGGAPGFPALGDAGLPALGDAG